MTPTLPATLDCPSPCHTLNQYALHTSWFAGYDNISLIFLEGVHNLSYNLTISFYHSRDLVEFQGQGKVPEDTVITLLCSAYIELRYIAHLKLENIQVEQKSIQQPHHSTIHISDTQVLSIRDCEFKNASVYISDSNETLIHRVHISNVYFWMELEFSSVSNVIIQDSILTTAQNGIRIHKASSVLIQRIDASDIEYQILDLFAVDNVTIQDSTLTAAQNGVWIKNASIVLIQRINVSDIERKKAFYLFRVGNVTIQDSTLAGVPYGVWVEEASSVLIQRIYASDIDYRGLNMKAVDNVTIQNSTVTACVQNGVWIERASNVLVRMINVSDIERYEALYLLIVGNVTIQDSTLSAAPYGVWIEEASSILIQQINASDIEYRGLSLLRVDNVTIGDSILSTAGDGVWINQSLSVLIQKINASNIKHQGLYMRAVNGVTIQDSTLTSCVLHGVMVEEASSVLIQQTSTSDIEYQALYLHTVDNVTIQDSTFTDVQNGVWIEEASSVLIQQINASDIERQGLYIKRARDKVTILESTLTACVQNGVWIEEASSVLIQQINVSDIEKNEALYLLTMDEVTILDSTLIAVSYGVWIRNASSVFIRQVNTSKIKYRGLFMKTVNNVTIQDSTLTDVGDGVRINNASSVSIQRINVSDIEHQGLYMRAVDKVTVQDSTLTACVQNGVWVEEASSVLIQRISVSDIERNESLYLLLVGNVTIQASELTAVRYGVQIERASSVVIQRIKASEIKYEALDLLTVDNVTIQDSTFTAVHYGVRISAASSVLIERLNTYNIEYEALFLSSVSYMTIQDSSFCENQVSPITLYSSTIELRGETVFKDNTAERGGGLAIYNSKVIFGNASNTMFISNTANRGGALALYDSTLTFSETSNVTFMNNTAEEFGGAVYVHALPTVLRDHYQHNGTIKITNLVGQECFYTTTGTSNVLKFANNKAGLGGLDIYGATLYTDECSLQNDFFHFDRKLLSLQVSSDPTRVCFCINNVPQCKNRKYLMLNETRYPGETFTASVVLTGYNLGRVAGSVYTNTLGRDYEKVIRESEHVQTVELLECTNISYTVSSSDSIVLVLTAEEKPAKEVDEMFIHKTSRNVHSRNCGYQTVNNSPCVALLITPIFINVTLETCPLGFELNELNEKCECSQTLEDIEDTLLTCVIQDHTGYITREGTVWVGVDTSENNTDIYYWHRYCQRDYCNSSQTSVDPKSPDGQCSSNRSGILCGRCQDGYSLQLGGNKCIRCNNYLTLLIVFAVLGILLVVLIKLLDLTVTSGTVNGLIFYANVVWRNNAILFSLQDRQNIGYYVVTLPIAWINLDFGIETCFTENLDQLTKTGLQFLFPVYIWCIAGLIIIVCHYSTRATKLFGNNSVAVLATLFLLSYGRLFRNITDVFTFADVSDSNGRTHKVWSLDGNILYGVTPGHIALIVVALLFLILFLLPFTLTLLLVPFLRAKSHLPPLHWINTLKPFFDTYYGPFKDKKQHQMWTGILLVSRVVILILYASTSTSSPKTNILLMTIIATLLLMYSAMVGILYKKWSLSLLENIYIVNLAVLGGAFLSRDRSTSPNDLLSPTPTISLVTALFTFVSTVIGYSIKRITTTDRIEKLIQRKDSLRPFERAKFYQEAERPFAGAKGDGTGPTVQMVEVKDSYDPTLLRETLLETL